MLAALLASCSSTSNLEEDELLYRGIKSIDYDKWQRPKRDGDSTGVIVALANAYNTVEGLLSGNTESLQIPGDELSKEALDSMKRADKNDELAYKTAREEVEAVLAYAPNGSLMGSSSMTHPFPIRLWIYNRYAGSKSRFGKWMFNHFAAKPVYVSTVNPKVRTSVAHNTLRNFGFFRAQVGYDTIPMKHPLKAKLAYHIVPGKLFHIDGIQRLDFPSAIDSLIQANQNQTLLHSGDAFAASKLDAERNRITKLLRDNGYFYYRPEYVQFRADTLQRPLYMQMQVQANPVTPAAALRPYHIGRTFVRILRNGDYLTTDTLPEHDGFTFAYSGNDKKPLINPGAVRRMMFYRRGDLYRQNLQDLWQEKMAESGLFSQVKADYALRDTSGMDTLDVTVTATLDKVYDAKFEGKAAMKSNGQVGPGVSFSMTKNNAFRGGETLGFDVWGSYEWQTGADLHGDGAFINSYEYGSSLHLSYPRLLFFGLGKQIGRRALTSTQFKINARCQNRANYFGRFSLGASISYTYRRRRNIKHEFTPLHLEYDLLLNHTQRFDSILAYNPPLAVSMQDQFVPSMEYTYSWRSTRHQPRTFNLTLKEAGNATSLIYAAAGKSLQERGKELFGVPFAQYVKVAAQYTHDFRLTQRSSIATRVFAGAIYSYGNTTSAPYADLFTVGGANSIRAFAMRSIGPGSFHPAQGGYAYILQVGDAKLELNAEYRFPIVGNLYGAAFVDAGNVWRLRDFEDLPGGMLRLKNLGKDLALGTGLGVRYDLDFLVLRFDVGVGIHAPYDTGRTGYYNMPSFGKSIAYHFAIGYPF